MNPPRRTDQAIIVLLIGLLSIAALILTPGSLAQVGTWQIKAPMPTAQAGFAAGIMNRMLYGLGRRDASNYLTTIKPYLAAAAGDDTTVGTATAGARSSTWIAVDVSFAGDKNGNGYTIYEIGTSNSGPFSTSGAFWPQLSGSPEWRASGFTVAPNTTYFVRVTFVDPDGVTGTNPQVIGPITTPASAPNAVMVEAATAVARDTEIYVSVPVRDDANRNSGGIIEVATSAGGPWTRKAGSPSEANLPFHPKRARIRGLTPGTDYWVRVTITDPDGVTGTNPQTIGPLRYSGLANLALGKSITADPGWGCCPSPSQLVDGRIQNDAWFYGFAWTGGTSCWAGGCPPGFKQATIDLGAPTEFNRAVVWYHDPGSVPVVWKFQHSNDGVTWTDAYSNTQPVCRTATDAMPGAWYYPACGHDATFPTVTARYVRYLFDDRTLFGGIHGWAVEFEVYNGLPDSPAPKITSSTSVVSSVNPSTFGQSVTLTATVSPNSATGTVEFFDGSSSLGTASVSSGSASISTASLALGSHSITAVYSGDTNFLGSTSSVLTQTVNKANISTVVGTATATARSSTWIAVDVPFSGDENGNGHTIYEIGTSSNGPFSTSGAYWPKLSGPPEWRANVFSVAPSTTYYVRVTFVDTDGVAGTNPQIVGPMTTPAPASNAVTVESATAVARDTEIYVSMPILNDANRNSGGTIEIATSQSGPWVRKAGSPSEANLPFHPKRARIRGLTPGTDYWVRVTITDPDGVTGTNPQIIGPLRYSGLTNLALGKSITADPGWGCCPSPSQLVDGRIQNDAWFYGFAWTGGTSCWAGGCPPGFKHATVDLGAPTEFNRATVWYHDPGNVPVIWKFQYSNDGATWTDAHSNTEPRCRTTTDAMPGAWYYPACGHDATFSSVTARYVRYLFDDRTLFGGIHGWAVEFEVYNGPPDSPAPKITSSTSVVSSANPSTFGNSVTFTATVTAPGGTVTEGSVTFKEGTMVLAGPTALNSSGQASFNISSLSAGSHTITAEYSGSSGFNSSSGSVAQTVNKATPLITWSAPADIVYGTPLSGTQLNATASVPGSFSYTPSAGAVLNAGNAQTLSLNFTPTDTTNYNSATASVLINVTKAIATITLSNLNHTYDGTAKNATATTSPAGLSGVSITYDGSPTAPINAGSYAVVASLNNTNYQATNVTGTLVIAKATPMISWNTPADIIYGTALSGTQLNAASNVPGIFTYSPGAGTVLSAGSGQTLSVSFAPNDAVNYNSASASVQINVAKAALTVTADSKSKTYGAANPAFTASYSGFVLGQNASVLSGTLSFTTTATDSSPAGVYTITPGGLSSTNYNITFVDGTLTVDKAALTVTADNKSKTYGAPLPTFTASYSGFVLGEGPSVLSGTPIFTTTASEGSPVGTYTITPSGLSSANYNISFVDGSLTIEKAPLTIKADDKSKVYGEALPVFTTSYSGFVLGENESVLSGMLTFSTPATATSDVGIYVITPGGLTSSNYNITFQNGTLTVNKANQTITFGALAGKTYGDPPFTVNATASSGLPVSFSIASGPATISGNTVTITGAGTVIIRVSQTGNANYNAAPDVDQSLIVARAATAITIVLNNNPSIAGQPVSFAAYVSSGAGTPSGSVQFFSGPTLLGVASLIGASASFTTTALVAGSHSITAIYSGDSNFLSSTSPALLQTVAAPTPTGADVGVQLSAGSTTVTTTFSSITSGGTTTITPIDPRSAGTIPGGFNLRGGNLAFDISTTATFLGPITVCFQVPSITDPAVFSNLRILHSVDKLDLAVANYLSNNLLTLMGSGTGIFSAAANLAVGATPMEVVRSDLNLDDRADLVVVNQNSNSVSRFLGNGTGGFGARADFAVGLSPRSVAVGDFNQDGKPDLAVANYGSNDLSILLGDGSGGFSARADFAPVISPVSVAVGDFNRDGNPDLALASITTNSVSVLLGTGTGRFVLATNFAVGRSPSSVAVGDFNRDGRADLAVTNLSSNSVSVLLGNGSGGFGAAANLAVRMTPASVAVGDFNGDKNLDLVVANRNSNSVSRFLGNGAGGFGARADFAVGLSPNSVAIGDFNNDSKLDLAVANMISRSVSILLGSGTGSFRVARNFAAGTSPVSIAIGNFNRDTAVIDQTILTGPNAPNFATRTICASMISLSPFVLADVLDVTAPSIANVSANPSVLWPPNHEMVDITINYDMTDDYTPTEDIIRTLSVTSNELADDTGDGNTEPDWEIVDANHVRLRAERSGTGAGRVYTITVTCTDAAQNSSSRTVTVTVPQSKN